MSFRKICFGARSAEGSRSHGVLPSLLLTARRQHPLEFFRTLLTAATAFATDDLSRPLAATKNLCSTGGKTPTAILLFNIFLSQNLHKQ